MLQGTSSNVGKSVLTAALCRIFFQDGYLVAPFKAQNMALNSFVTANGGEMGRAQVVQAEACRIEPDVIMNPILLKPTRHAASQVIVLGRPVGNFSAAEYHNQYKDKAWQVIIQSLEKLLKDYQVLVIEGAGSPAEVNLKANDVVNMRVAKEIMAPVLLIADIDRGGALASIVGTLELLEPEERDLIRGLVINKFRGDINLLKPAIDFLENKTQKPVVGVIPYFDDIKIPEEDSVVIETANTKVKNQEKLDLAVINLPHISNFTDFDALDAEIDVELRYVKKGMTLGNPDLIIIPGSKNTIADMEYLRISGLAQDILDSVKNKKTPIIGICGGFQLLGEELIDANKVESDLGHCTGLGLLPIKTEFTSDKITSQVKGNILTNKGLLKGCSNLEIEGYEIHMGISQINRQIEAPFCLSERSQQKIQLHDGVINSDGLILGTYLHGIFDNDLLRRNILNNIREIKGLKPIAEPTVVTRQIRDEALDNLAKVVRENINLPLIYQIMGLA